MYADPSSELLAPHLNQVPLEKISNQPTVTDQYLITPFPPLQPNPNV